MGCVSRRIFYDQTTTKPNTGKNWLLRSTNTMQPSELSRRLTRERDEARDALSKVTISAGVAGNGDAMQIDSQGLPEDLAANVDATQETYCSKLCPFRQKFLLTVYLDSLRAVESDLCPRSGLPRRKLENLAFRWLRNPSTQARPFSLPMKLASRSL